MSITMIGLDTAKSVFQVHAVNATGKTEIKRKLSRNDLLPFFKNQELCTVILEALSVFRLTEDSRNGEYSWHILLG
jgi:transposase